MSDIDTYETYDYPTKNAFRLVNEAHTKMCVALSELGYPQDAEHSDEVDELAEQAESVLIDLFEAMCDERGFNSDEFENVYLDRGSEVWEDDD